MPTPNHNDLKPNHEAFVDEYLANGGQAKKAAVFAGYAENSAHVTASRLLRKPQIIDAIKSKTINRARICSPMAMEVLIRIANDNAVAPRDRIAASKEVLDRGGITRENPMMQVQVSSGGHTADALIAQIEAGKAIWAAKEAKKNEGAEHGLTTLSESPLGT